MKKFITMLLTGIMCVLLVGCGNTFAVEEYDIASKIVEKEDRYAKVGSVFNPIDDGYSLEVDSFDGRETLWSQNCKDSKDIDIEIKLSLSEGTCKIVHIDEDGNITTLIESSSENMDDVNVTKTASLKEGLNRIKIVGYGCKDVDLELHSSEF